MAPTPASPGEALWIGAAPGKNHFNVGIGQGTSGGQNHTDFGQAVIEDGYTDPDKFYLDPTTKNPIFRINAGAGRTSQNTAHPRSELRELGTDGTSKAEWDGRSNKHQLWGKSRLTEVTGNRPWICFYQCHGSEGSPQPSDLFRVQTEGPTGASTNLDVVCRRSPIGSSSEIRTVLQTGYNVGDWIAWNATFDGGRLKLTHNGVIVLDVNDLGQIKNYWKAGCYLQDNVEKGASATSWGAVEMERGSFGCWHTGYPQPTVPTFTGPDDGGGGGGAVDNVAPTVPGSVAAIRGDTQATLVWEASTDNVGVANYIVRRSSGGAAGAVGKADDSAASSASSTDKMALTQVSSTVTGTVTAGHARAWLSTAGSVGTKVVIYLDAADQPGALLATSDETTITATTEGVRDYVFSGGNQVQLLAGATYWIGLAWDDPGTPSLNLSREANANGRVEIAGFTYPTLPDPAGAGTSFAGPIDVWVETGGTTQIATPTGTTYVATGLTNGVQYGFTVSAIDAAGNESAPSDEVLVVPGPPDLTPPTVPTGLAAAPGDRRISLSWTASTDADTGVRGYRVRRGGVLVGEPTGTTFVDTELTNGVQQSYTVSAVDGSLNESSQTSAVLATPVAPPIGGVSFLEDDLGPGAAIAVEVAFGADLTADPATWAWTDITADVRQNPGISTSLGRNDESGTSNPAQLSLTLNNPSGDYSLGGRSRWWPYVRRNTPVRLRIDPGDGGGGRVVFWGGADGWTPGWDSLTGRVPIVALSASGTLRRLAQGDAPVQSAFRRAMTGSPTVVAYWPMEEGSNAAYAPAVRGGSAMTFVGRPDWASSDSFFCSDRLPTMKDGVFDADVRPYPDTGLTQVRFLLHLPESGVPNGAILAWITTTGSIARWDITYSGVGRTDQTIGVYRYLANGSLHSRDHIGFAINDRPGRLSLELRQSGSDIAWRIAHVESDPDLVAGFYAATITGHTAGVVSHIQLATGRDLADTVIGHLTVENAISSQFADRAPLLAFTGEVASSSAVNPYQSRLERLAAENGVALTRHTSTAAVRGEGLTDFDRMGPQLVAPLLDLFHEAETADQGQLWDGRAHGLSYTTRRRREECLLRLTIDAAAGELADGFAPVDDDQRTRNRVEIRRTHGITAAWEDTTGPLGTDTIGVYDESITANLGRDQDVIEHAQWKVSLGTVEGHRYPSVRVDLRANPHLAAAVLDAIPGERIKIVNLDDTLAAFTAPTVSLLIEGISHEITGKSWWATFRCSPAEPWAVGRIAAETGDTSDMVMRLDTDGSQLAAAAAKGATSLSVATTVGALWTTTADDYPLMLSVGGLPVRATGCSGSSSPQTVTVDALPVARAAGAPVQLWEPRRLGMGKSIG